MTDRRTSEHLKNQIIWEENDQYILSKQQAAMYLVNKSINERIMKLRVQNFYETRLHGNYYKRWQFCESFNRMEVDLISCIDVQQMFSSDPTEDIIDNYDNLNKALTDKLLDGFNKLNYDEKEVEFDENLNKEFDQKKQDQSDVSSQIKTLTDILQFYETGDFFRQNDEVLLKANEDLKSLFAALEIRDSKVKELIKLKEQLILKEDLVETDNNSEESTELKKLTKIAFKKDILYIKL